MRKLLDIKMPKNLPEFENASFYKNIMKINKVTKVTGKSPVLHLLH